MPGFLRQSTASQGRTLGPFISDTDFKSPATGLTIANTDVKLSMAGGASANKNSGGGTHRVNGDYGFTFDATDTATVGPLRVNVVVAGALPVWRDFVVVEEAVFDALFAASAPGYVVDQPVNVTKIGGTAQTAGDVFARIGAPAGASIAADVAAVKVDTAAVKVQTDKMVFTVANHLDVNVLKWIGGTIPAVNVTGVPLVDLKYTLGTISPATPGTVRADAGDPLSVALPGAYGAGTMGYLIGTNLNATVSSRLAASSYTAPLTAGATADAVWDATLADHLDAGSTGEGLSNAGAAGTPPTVTEIADEVQTRTIAAVTVVNGLAANTVNASALATDAVTEMQSGLATASAVAALPQDKTGYALTSAYDFAKGTVAMTESYAADGATMTPVQAFYMLWSLFAERDLVSTTLTAKKLDGSTTAMTFTLDDAVNPTSQTRAT